MFFCLCVCICVCISVCLSVCMGWFLLSCDRWWPVTCQDLGTVYRKCFGIFSSIELNLYGLLAPILGLTEWQNSRKTGERHSMKSERFRGRSRLTGLWKTCKSQRKRNWSSKTWKSQGIFCLNFYCLLYSQKNSWNPSFRSISVHQNIKFSSTNVKYS